MITRLRGTLLEKRAPTLVVDVGGVGYEVDAPLSTIEALPETGREVLLQFLVEATLLSLFGGGLGIALGLGLAAVAAPWLGVPFVFDPTIVVIAFLFSGAVGVLFGYVPARRAARLDPVMHPVGDPLGRADHGAMTAPGSQAPQQLSQGGRLAFDDAQDGCVAPFWAREVLERRQIGDRRIKFPVLAVLPDELAKLAQRLIGWQQGVQRALPLTAIGTDLLYIAIIVYSCERFCRL